MTTGHGLAVKGGAGKGVEGAGMAGPGGSDVNPQEGRTGTGLWGEGGGRAGPRGGSGAREGSRTNTGARESSVAGATGIRRKGKARGLSVGVIGTRAQDDEVCVCVTSGGLRPGLGFLKLGEQ